MCLQYEPIWFAVVVQPIMEEIADLESWTRQRRSVPTGRLIDQIIKTWRHLHQMVVPAPGDLAPVASHGAISIAGSPSAPLKTSCEIICCIQVVPDLAQVPIMMSPSLNLNSLQRLESMTTVWYSRAAGRTSVICCSVGGHVGTAILALRAASAKSVRYCASPKSAGFGLTSDARELPIGLQHRAGLVVIDDA
jgi:hypothetical protein